MKNTHDLRVSARTAQLLASDGDDGDGPPWRFSGVAVAAGDILHMDDGTPVLFTAEELRAAAETQTDEPLTVDHPTDDSGRPQYPPPTDETVGKVQKAGYVDDVDGVAYEATTHDEDIANGVQAGSFEVSVHPTFELGETDPETGARKATNIKFRDLSTVSKGDSPSNTAEWGPNQALASWTQSNDIGEELTAAEQVEDEDTRSLVERLAERVGILNTDDMRGGVRLRDQTTNGEMVTVRDAGFDDAPWMVSVHGPGEEFADIGEGLGPALGTSEAFDAGDYEGTVEIPLAESLQEDQTLFALLRYQANGEVSDPIPTSDGSYYLDSGFVAVAPDGVMDDDAGEVTADASTSDEPAESGTDADTDPDSLMGTDPDDNTDPDDAPDDGNGADGGDGTDSKTLADMTVDELGSALREQGFVTEDGLDEAVANAQDQMDKAEKVEEIVAKSDDFGEEDREGLMASSNTLVDREYKRIRGELAAQLPGNGKAATLTASADSDAEADEYGTGVQED